MRARRRDYESGLAAEKLRSLLEYDPETGEFRWRQDQLNGSKAGDLAGYLTVRGRRRIKIDNQPYFANRLAWVWMTGEWPKSQVDHRDLNRANDRWENLRLANSSQNKANSRVRADSRTGIKGVFYDAHRNRYTAQVAANGKRTFLGRFLTAEEASAAYQAAAKELHQDFFRSE